MCYDLFCSKIICNTGFAVFFPDAGTITVALSVGVFVNLGLAMLNKATVPGMIRVLVPWETGIYVAGAWVFFSHFFHH